MACSHIKQRLHYTYVGNGWASLRGPRLIRFRLYTNSTVAALAC